MGKLIHIDDEQAYIIHKLELSEEDRELLKQLISVLEKLIKQQGEGKQ